MALLHMNFELLVLFEDLEAKVALYWDEGRTEGRTEEPPARKSH